MPTNQIVYNQRGKQNHENEPGCSPCIKINAGNKYHSILVFSIYKKISEQEKGKEINKKNNAAEYHEGKYEFKVKIIFESSRTLCKLKKQYFWSLLNTN